MDGSRKTEDDSPAWLWGRQIAAAGRNASLKHDGKRIARTGGVEGAERVEGAFVNDGVVSSRVRCAS